MSKPTSYMAVLSYDELIEMSCFLNDDGSANEEFISITFDPFKKVSGDSEYWGNSDYIRSIHKKLSKENFGAKKVKELKKTLNRIGKSGNYEDVLEFYEVLNHFLKLVEKHKQ